MAVVEVTAPVGVKGQAVVARNAGILLGSQFATWCAALAWSVVVPRVIGPAETGLYTLGVAASSVLMVVVGLGTRPLLVREMAAQPERASRLLGTSIALRAILLPASLLLVAAYSGLGHLSHDEFIAVMLGWGMCAAYVLYEPIQAAFQAMDRMQYLAYSDILTKTLASGISIVIVLIGARAFGLLATSIGVMLFVFGLNLLWARKHFRIAWRSSRQEIAKLCRDSLPYWGFAAFFTIYLWIDSLMLGVMTPSTVLGWYGLPTKLFGTLLFIPTILSTAWLPDMVRSAGEGGDRIWRTARSSIELVLILSMPVCAGTILVTPSLFHLLYGSAYAGSVPVMIILAGCLPLMYFGSMVNQVLIARQRQIQWTKVMALASVFNPLCNLVLIPYFQRRVGNGAVGASVSMFLTELLIAGIGIAMMRRAFSRWTLLRLIRAILATAGMTVAVALTLTHGGLAAGIASGMVVFPLLAWVLRVLSAEERKQLSALVRRVGGRVG